MDNQAKNTIIEQLGGMKRVYAMTDATGVVYTANGIQIMFPRNKYVAIDLQAGQDQYTLKAFKLNGRTLEIKTTFEQKNIFNFELMGMFELATGMVLSF